MLINIRRQGEELEALVISDADVFEPYSTERGTDLTVAEVREWLSSEHEAPAVADALLYVLDMAQGYAMTEGRTAFVLLRIVPS